MNEQQAAAEAATQSTALVPQVEWKPSGGVAGNIIAKGEGFAVSYLPPNNMLNGTIFASDGPEGETALIAKGNFYILNGDHREAYTPLIPQGKNACMAYYRSKPELRSGWSD